MLCNKFIVTLAFATHMAAAYRTICSIVATSDDAEIGCIDEKLSSDGCLALASNFGNYGTRENPCFYSFYVGDASYEELEEVCTSNGGELLSADKPLDPSNGNCIAPDL